MRLNADRTQRAVEYSEDLPWRPSPLPGVERRMLERDGEEVARATSIVRYASESYFDSHVHDLGEEFLVLTGTFSDEMGDFPAGMYVRNPPGSCHKPYTVDGCTILVKLRQFDPTDDQYVRVDTRRADWLPGRVRGVEVMPLYARGGERVALVRLLPGARLESTGQLGGEEIFVIDGVLEDEQGRYPKGTWLRNPPGSGHALSSTDGCTLYVKIGHLSLLPEGAAKQTYLDSGSAPETSLNRSSGTCGST